MKTDDNIVYVDNIVKAYKLYNKKSDCIKEIFNPSKKKYHQAFYALNGISFDVKKGETVGIIGTNGSGKSTLLKILTGVVAPTAGEYHIEGKVAALLELGAGFNPDYTGIENIRLNGVTMGYTAKEIESKISDIVAFAEIGEYINQPLKTYSSGMFARLAFSVAVSVYPDVLIVDEALSVGDVFFQGKCFRKFRELKEKGTSIIFVSHDLESVRGLCDRVLWIEKGNQIMFGETQDVCDEYFNAQVELLNKYNKNGLSIDNAHSINVSSVVSKLYIPKIHYKPDSILSDEVEILSVFVEDDRGQVQTSVFPNREYSVVIISKANIDVSGIIVGFVLNNRKGIAVIGSNTYITLGEGINIKKGDIIKTKFSFVMPQVRSGEYEIAPAIAKGTQDKHVIMTWLHGASRISLAEGKYEFLELMIPYKVDTSKVGEIEFY